MLYFMTHLIIYLYLLTDFFYSFIIPFFYIFKFNFGRFIEYVSLLLLVLVIGLIRLMRCLLLW